jgi:sec-independent protein translocase protein TatB
MFDIGFWELLLIFTLGMLVLGPERLPRVARRIGRWTGQAKAMARSLRTQLESEMELSELKKQAAKFNEPVTPAPQPKKEQTPSDERPKTEGG